MTTGVRDEGSEKCDRRLPHSQRLAKLLRDPPHLMGVVVFEEAGAQGEAREDDERADHVAAEGRGGKTGTDVVDFVRGPGHPWAEERRLADS